jgi:hypothetical protein
MRPDDSTWRSLYSEYVSKSEDSPLGKRRGVGLKISIMAFIPGMNTNAKDGKGNWCCRISSARRDELLGFGYWQSGPEGKNTTRAVNDSTVLSSLQCVCDKCVCDRKTTGRKMSQLQIF